MSTPQPNIEKVVKDIRRTITWCPVCSSVELKKLIKEKARANGVNFFYLCKGLNIPYSVFKQYWLQNHEPGSVRGVRATEIQKIAEVLGIKFKLIIVNGNIDLSAIKPYIKNNINKKRYVQINKR